MGYINAMNFCLAGQAFWRRPPLSPKRQRSRPWRRCWSLIVPCRECCPKLCGIPRWGFLGGKLWTFDEIMEIMEMWKSGDEVKIFVRWVNEDDLFLMGKGRMLLFVALFLCNMGSLKCLKLGEIGSLQAIHSLTFCNCTFQNHRNPVGLGKFQLQCVGKNNRTACFFNVFQRRYTNSVIFKFDWCINNS